MLRFLLNDLHITEHNLAADLTVLDYLRDRANLRGTKEGCASGDCGACTAVVGYVVDGRMQYKSINTCITLIGSLHGQQLITVEHLQNGQELHPVQAAMVNYHGSQCGFCTPGFVMSLFAMAKNSTDIPSDARAHIERYLGGNLCRCTGYRPIFDAAMHILQTPDVAKDKFQQCADATVKALGSISSQAETGEPDDSEPEAGPLRNGPTRSDTFLRPRSIDELSDMRSRYPDAPIAAGTTDLSLEITQRLREFDRIISIQKVADLDYLTSDENNYYIGPCCTIATLARGLTPLGNDVVNMLHRFGATQVRNQATVGGSIGNASPIGDLAPVFISMDATIVLQSIEGQRRMPLEAYFVDYRQTQLAANEFIREIIVPRQPKSEDIGTHNNPQNNPHNNTHNRHQLKVYKVSKRIEDDISTVCAAFYLRRNGDRIEEFRTGFGGMAAIPKRASALEQLVHNQVVDDKLIAGAGAALATDFQPLSDARASADYRLQVATNLFRRLCIETGQEAVVSRVGDHV